MSFSFRAVARPLAILAVLAFAGTAFAHEYKAGTLDIDHPWTRATLPGAKVAAGYMTVKNSGSEPDRLVSVSTDIADKAEIHEMAVDPAGVMTMRPLAGALEIPAGGEAKLAPKGLHIMFMGLKTQLVEKERYKATLTFEKAGKVEVEFKAEPIGESHDAH
ncbi:copper chaperone PCu(A)C [Arvimicrobium flavum]|uniref:copper chaperone PCu(A)C n=1 Tax=Arvimicrobium flavum TaxID=3393320 RepID=UPI00237BA4CA|nr:copper chaperone PCu(A)C [Mesorhizobium shangrilense]